MGAFAEAQKTRLIDLSSQEDKLRTEIRGLVDAAWQAIVEWQPGSIYERAYAAAAGDVVYVEYGNATTGQDLAVDIPIDLVASGDKAAILAYLKSLN